VTSPETFGYILICYQESSRELRRAGIEYPKLVYLVLLRMLHLLGKNTSINNMKMQKFYRSVKKFM
jgi:hypothetical protein